MGVKRKVDKALSAEEATLLSNIRSMVDELEQINAGEATASADEEDLDIVISPEEDDEDEKKKLMMSKSDEGPTANDKADERLETTDEETEKNINAVKALIARMDRKIRVERSRKTERDTLVLKEICVIAQRLDVQEQAIMNLIKGLGVADEIKKSITPRKKVKPVQSTDVQAVLKSLLGQAAADEKKEDDSPRPKDSVRKSLADRKVLTALLGQ